MRKTIIRYRKTTDGCRKTITIPAKTTDSRRKTPLNASQMLARVSRNLAANASYQLII